MTNIKLTKSENKKLRAFTMHGVNLHSEAGRGQVLADCPFCGKEEHFYINRENLLWDCKVCGLSGNLLKFLELLNTKNKKNLTERVLRRLADDRGMPMSAFKQWELGYQQGQYTFAVRNDAGKIQDLRMYKIGHKVMSTAQAKTGLFGLNQMLESKDEPVYICEGEWDTIAMQALLHKAKQKGRAICSPGANVFKAEWADYFRQRKVYVCYDNDQAGDKGQQTVASRLNGITTGIKFLHWKENKSLGYDIRDFYKDEYLTKKKPKKAMKKLLGMMRPTPRGEEGEEGEEGQIQVKEAIEVDPSITREDVHAAYRAKLYQPDLDVIDICAASLISNWFKTRPIWYFLVAPPSSGKTEIIKGFNYLMPPYEDMAMSVSKLTPQTLISGMKSHKDPSLLSRFDGRPKTLFIKDFTPILKGPDNEKNEIFGTLRDAHDGYSSKEFGNGISRRYDKLNFSIIAAVTYEIYAESTVSASLGERFGKIILRSDESLVSEEIAGIKGLNNIGKEEDLDDNVAKVFYSAIHNIKAWIEAEGITEKNLPEIPVHFQKQIMQIAQYTAHMRAGISRDRFKKDYINSKPTVEKPYRFAIMLGATAIFLALWNRRRIVTAEDIRILRKIALDTVNQRDEEILRKCYVLNNLSDKEPTKRNIQQASMYTNFTVECVLQDFSMVGVLKRRQVNKRTHFMFTKKFLEILKGAGIYQNEEELNRVEASEQDRKYLEKKSNIKKRKKAIFKKK